MGLLKNMQLRMLTGIPELPSRSGLRHPDGYFQGEFGFLEPKPEPKQYSTEILSFETDTSCPRPGVRPPPWKVD